MLGYFFPQILPLDKGPLQDNYIVDQIEGMPGQHEKDGASPRAKRTAYLSKSGGSMRRMLFCVIGVFAIALLGGFLQAHASEQDEWSYGGSRGPLHWGHLSSEFALCEKGMAQSPIDLLRPRAIRLDDIQFSYKNAPFQIINNGHTVEEIEPLSDLVRSRYPQHGLTVEHFEKDSAIVFDHDVYLLEQFHFHVPSEHTIDQQHFAMELHLVHHNERHEAAVVAVLMKEGAHNPFFEAFLNHAPTHKGEVINDLEQQLNPADFLPERRGYYRYFGSYTTPPCHEGVIWAVLHDPIEVSADQINQFRTLVGSDNVRPTQPLHKRLVLDSNVEVNHLIKARR
jgi:carbonic anhydrase